MKKYMLAAICLASACAFTACNSDSGKQEGEATDTTTAPAETDTTGTATAAPTDTTLTDEQKQFLGDAYKHTQLQLSLAKIATQKGTTDDVKEYGQRISQIYTTRQKELAEMAKQQNVTLPTALDDNEQEKVDNLAKAKPDEFDKAYWDNTIDAHKAAIDEFDDIIKDVPQNNVAPFNLWVRNTRKEMQAQMEQAMRMRLDQRSGA